MLIISLIGTILVIIGVLLTFPEIRYKINVKTTVGWSLAFIGMVLLAVSGFIKGSIIFGIISVILAIGNLYFLITDLKNKENG